MLAMGMRQEIMIDTSWTVADVMAAINPLKRYAARQEPWWQCRALQAGPISSAMASTRESSFRRKRSEWYNS